jgi:hypothetical protein
MRDELPGCLPKSGETVFDVKKVSGLLDFLVSEKAVTPT